MAFMPAPQRRRGNAFRRLLAVQLQQVQSAAAITVSISASSVHQQRHDLGPIARPPPPARTLPPADVWRARQEEHQPHIVGAGFQRRLSTASV
jgi:hypothetical protein